MTTDRRANFQHGAIPRSAADGRYTKLVVGPKTDCGGPMLPWREDGSCRTCGQKVT